MDAKSPRWRQITPSQYAWEADALDYLRTLLPDRDPYRAWANLEYTSREGRVYEVDALVITPNGIFLIEIKSTPGTVSGDSATWRWANDRGTSTRDNPLRLANYKAKVLKGLIEQSGPWRQKRMSPIFVEPLVFLSAPGLTSKLSADGRVNVVVRDPEEGQAPAGPGVKGIDEFFRSYVPPHRHSRPGSDVSRALVDALEAVGVRESQRSRQVGGWLLDAQAIDEGPDYQDFVARHRTLDSVRRRIRIFPTPANMGRERRQVITKAVSREFELLNGLEHPAIDVPTEMEEHELGPALVYDFEPNAQALDIYLDERAQTLAVDTRLHLLRQISETIAYAHSRRLVHRTLSPRSIMVLDPTAVTPRIKVLNWQTVRQLSDGGESRSTSNLTTLPIPDLLDERAAAYVAPEFFSAIDVDGELLDVFSLGAIAFLIFSGRAAAGSQSELAALVAKADGLRLDAASDEAVPPTLARIVRDATRPLVEDRLQSAAEFLSALTEVEDELTEPTPEITVDPLDARKGDRLAGGYLVDARLGSGATAVGLAVIPDNGTHAGKRVVIKVALTEDHSDRLRMEAEILAGLRHDAIVECFAITDIAGHTTLLLSSAGDYTLDQILRSAGRLSLDQLERFGTDLLEAVRYLERTGVAHRDIKPGNLGVTEVGPRREQHVVLFDFSLSRTAADALRAGTPPYLEPFLSVQKRTWDLHAERYAVAVTLYEMATAALPVWGEGRSDPALTDGEVTIDTDLLPVECRSALETFFRKALRRTATERFATAEDMQRAWQRALTGSPATTHVSNHPAGPPTTLEGDARIDGPVAGVATEAPTADALQGVTFTTALAQLGLSARASNALDRMSLLTVGDLLAAGGSLVSTKGIGHRVRREILETRRHLRSRLGDAPPTITNVSQPDVSITGSPPVERLAELLVPPAKRKQSQEPAALRAFLGLDHHDGLSPWPASAEVAEVVGITRGRMGQIIPAARQAWNDLAPLSRSIEAIAAALQTQGNVLGLDQLIDAVLADSGSEAPADRRRNLAGAVVRAAVEVETHRPDPRFLLRQRDGRMAVASIDSAPDSDQDIDAPAQDRDAVVDARDHEGLRKADARLFMAFALGDIADRLVADLEVVDPVLATARLIAVDPVPGDAPLPDHRMLRLAAATSRTAAVSSRSEFYPRGMDAKRALRLSRPSLAGLEQIPTDELRSRVAARYPEAVVLPDRPLLDDLLRDAGLDLVWNHASNVFRRPADTTGLTTVTQTHHLGTAVARVLAGAPEAAGFDVTLQRSTEQGGFLALMVSTPHYQAAVRALTKLSPVVIDVDRAIVNALRAQADGRVPWTAVVAADREGPTGANWSRFSTLVAGAIDTVRNDILAAGPHVLLIYPGLLARYQRTDLLDALRDAAGATSSSLVTAWVLIAVTDPTSAPTIDDEPVRLTSPNQWARIPTGWIDRERAAHLGVMLDVKPEPQIHNQQATEETTA